MYALIFFTFLGWGEAESTWYVGHYWPGWWMMMMMMMMIVMSVEQSVEWEFVGETEILRQNLPYCHFVQHFFQFMRLFYTKDELLSDS
jgi:hypothetical protein